MEHLKKKKKKKLLEKVTNQTFKFRTKNWVEMKDNAHRTYNTNSQIKFKTTTKKSGDK